MAKFSFFGFFMPTVHNQVEAAKYHAERGDHKSAHLSLDGAEKTLRAARDQTKKEIEDRDRDG